MGVYTYITLLFSQNCTIMKRIIVLSTLLLFFAFAFSQEEENGTIYIKHPNIETVNKTVQAYMNKDWAAEKSFYSDTAKWWVSGLDKPIPIADAFKDWATDFDYFDDVKQVKSPGSYPDYLHYKDKDEKTVMSWWVWSGKSKKTGEVIKVPLVVFDDFDNNGKIVRESMWGDFSKLVAAKTK